MKVILNGGTAIKGHATQHYTQYIRDATLQLSLDRAGTQHDATVTTTQIRSTLKPVAETATSATCAQKLPQPSIQAIPRP